MNTKINGFENRIKVMGDFLLRPTNANQNKKLRLAGSIAIGIFNPWEPPTLYLGPSTTSPHVR